MKSLNERLNEYISFILLKNHRTKGDKYKQFFVVSKYLLKILSDHNL